MTKDQIKELVAAKIAGQGTQVDAGGVLPAIFNAIVDKLVEDAGEYATLAEIDEFEEFDKTTNYSAGDIVRKGGKIYYFTANKDAGEWDSSKVEQTSVFALLAETIGNLDDLVTTAKTSLVDALNELAAEHYLPTVSIAAVESADLTAEQAAAAGFTPEVIAMLQQAHKPTVEFSDMCVTFTAVEVISEDLVNQSTVIVDTAVGGGTLYKAILSLKTDGSVTYTVTELS